VQLYSYVFRRWDYCYGDYGLFEGRGVAIATRSKEDSLVHTRLVHVSVLLASEACTRLHNRNINNVLLNGIIDFDLAIVRLLGDGSWSDHHLIYCKKLMSGSPITTTVSPAPVPVPAPAPAPGPKPLTCNYCDSCVNGVTVPAQVDPGCPPMMISCVSGACQPPVSSSGSSTLSWICLACSIICCLFMLLSTASAGSSGSLFTGFILGDILGSLTR